MFNQIHFAKYYFGLYEICSTTKNAASITVAKKYLIAAFMLQRRDKNRCSSYFQIKLYTNVDHPNVEYMRALFFFFCAQTSKKKDLINILI
jgi:hypothetical protein